MRSCVCPSQSVLPVTALSVAVLFATALTIFYAANVAVAQPLAAAPDVAAPAHLKAALDLVQTVTPETTSYRHREGLVKWRMDEGTASSVCHTDCSGLADALLKRAYGLNDDNLRQWFKTRRPLARHYYATIERKQGFLPIAAVKDIRPGDFLAARYEGSEKGENTGHVMLVAQAPRERKATAPLVNGTRQWEVKIIDESSSDHGPTDTRRRPDGKKGSGVGVGVMRLYTDSDGQIVGYTWSTSRKSEFRSPDNRPLLVGRIDPEFVKSLKAEKQ